MPVQQVGGGDRIDLQLERSRQVGLKRQFQGGDHGVGRFFVVRPVQHQRAARLGDEVEEPFRHLFVEGGQHRQQVVLPPLLQKRLERVDGGVRIAVIVATRVDEVDQVTG